ncbi:Glyoxalase/Bleomycin resistance protein/Dioxygenase superfamily protein [compost metagenome]
MKIAVTSVLVDDQTKALAFYRDVLGFELKHDIPMGTHRWLTLTSPGDPNGVELLLEPDAHPAAKPFKSAIKQDGIPYTFFSVEDVHAEHARLCSASPNRRRPWGRLPSPYSTTRAAISSRSSNRIEPLTALVNAWDGATATGADRQKPAGRVVYDD